MRKKGRKGIKSGKIKETIQFFLKWSNIMGVGEGEIIISTVLFSLCVVNPV